MPTRQFPGYDGHFEPDVEDANPEVLVYSTGIDGEENPGALSDAQQIALLKRQLAEKDQAILRAVISRTEMEQELEDTRQILDNVKEEATAQKVQLQAAIDQQKAGAEQAPRTEVKGTQDALDEIARLKTEFFRAQKALDRERRTHSAELAKAKMQVLEVQNELEKENRARRLEAAQSSAKIAGLQKEVTETRTVATAKAAEKKGAGGNKIRYILGGVAAALVVGVVVTWTQFTAHASVPGRASLTQEGSGNSGYSASGQTGGGAETRAAGKALPPMTIPPPMELSRFSPEARGNFQGSLSRLNKILLNFPGRSPEEVLKAVHIAYAKTDPNMCSFEWNHGQPALIYTGEGGNKLSLSGTLNRCAEALENFH